MEGYPTLGTPHLDLARGYPIPVGGTPPQVTPHPDLTRRYPIPAGGHPTSGNPHHYLARGVPHPCWGVGGVPQVRHPPSGPSCGTLLSGPGWGTPPCQTWLGYSPYPIRTWLGTPCLGLARVPPAMTWPGYPPSGPDQGTPPFRCRQTDRHVSKHDLPVILRKRSVIILWSLPSKICQSYLCLMISHWVHEKILMSAFR